jgi:ABC-type Fe3+ transport system permease subunit
MSGQLSHPAPTWQPPAEPRPTARRVAIDVVAILMAFGVVGVACGFLWEHVWNPPAGLAYQHKWLLDGDGLPNDFSGTGLYAVIGAVAGLVLGLVLALLLDRDEVISLAAILAGAVLAAYLMWAVGRALGPPNPNTLASTADDFEPIPADLRVHGKAAFLAFPTGAMLAATAVFFLFPRRRARFSRGSRSDPAG